MESTQSYTAQYNQPQLPIHTRLITWTEIEKELSLSKKLEEVSLVVSN